MAARRRHVEKRADSQLCPARGRHAFCRRGVKPFSSCHSRHLGQSIPWRASALPWTKISSSFSAWVEMAQEHNDEDDFQERSLERHLPRHGCGL
jgi:hypothetical protein